MHVEAVDLRIFTKDFQTAVLALFNRLGWETVNRDDGLIEVMFPVEDWELFDVFDSFLWS